MLNKALIILFLISFLFGIPLSAKDSITLGSYINIPQVGISLKLFKDMKRQPLILPGIYKTKTESVEVYKTNEFWKYRQFVGKWHNKYSQITVVNMKYTSDILDSPFLKKEDSESSIKNFSCKKMGIDKIEDWLIKFFDLKSIKKLTEYEIDSNAVAVIYFSVNKDYWNFIAVYYKKNDINRKIVFSYNIDNDFDKKYAVREVINSLDSIKKNKRSDDDTRIVYLDKESREGVDGDDSLDFILNSIKSLNDWKILVSSYYYIVTNCNIRDKSDGFIKIVTDTLEKGRHIYEYFYPAEFKNKEKFIVRIFNDREGYASYVGEDYKWTGGLWMSGKKELVLTKSDFTSTEKKRFIRVLKHEAFHQYIHYAAGEIVSSAWFNEGNAQFFENVSLVGNRIFIKPVKTKLAFIKKHLKDKDFESYISLLLKKNYEEFYKKEECDLNYNLAWAIVYFINTESKTIINKYNRDYSKILIDYYKNLCLLKSSFQVTEKVWGNIDLNKFTSDMIFYYKVYVKNSSTEVIDSR